MGHRKTRHPRYPSCPGEALRPRFRNAVNSFSRPGVRSRIRLAGLPFDRIGILADLRRRGLALAASDQLNEFLRCRNIAAKLAALLRHGATNARGVRGRIDPPFGRAGFAGRGCIANIEVAITHDCCPLFEEGRQRASSRKVARCLTESGGPRLRFTGRPRFASAT